MDAQEVDSYFDLVNGNQHRRVLVRAVPAGREILQEQPARILQILTDAIQAAQARPLVAVASFGNNTKEDPADLKELQKDEPDTIDRRDHRVASRLSSTLTTDDRESEEEQKCNGAPDGAVFPDSACRVTNLQLGQDAQQADLPVETSPPRSRQYVSRKSRRAREFDARKERAAERKSKSERLRRQQELGRMKKTKQELVENAKRQLETVAMHEEDHRSRATETYTR